MEITVNHNADLSAFYQHDVCDYPDVKQTNLLDVIDDSFRELWLNDQHPQELCFLLSQGNKSWDPQDLKRSLKYSEFSVYNEGIEYIVETDFQSVAIHYFPTQDKDDDNPLIGFQIKLNWSVN